jgi:ATP-dependent Clp protease adaptor protein ClpS
MADRVGSIEPLDILDVVDIMPRTVAASPAKTAPVVDVAPPKTTTGVDYVVINAEELERPYRVIIQNDDVTPMDFVVLVLLTIFELEIERAMSVMLDAHNNGRALVRTLPLEDAQQRVYSAQSLAREAGYPLSFYLEPDS